MAQIMHYGNLKTESMICVPRMCFTSEVVVDEMRRLDVVNSHFSQKTEQGNKTDVCYSSAANTDLMEIMVEEDASMLAGEEKTTTPKHTLRKRKKQAKKKKQSGENLNINKNQIKKRQSRSHHQTHT